MPGIFRRSWSQLRSITLMGGGTALVGISGYAFVALAGHTLEPAQAAAVSSFYLLVNIIGPGLFVAVEQETSRATSSSLALGGNLGGALRTATMHAAGLLGAVCVVLVVSSPWLVPRTLLGHWDLLVAVLLSSVTFAGVFLTRGVLGGMRLFGGYSATLAVEGLMRLFPPLLAAGVGLAGAGPYGILFALGSGVGTLAGLHSIRKGYAAGTDVPAEPSTGSVGEQERAQGATLGTAKGLIFLVGATLLAQLVANLAPIVVTGRMVGDVATAAAFASAFILARIPLFVISPAQALVLPRVSSAAQRGEHAAVRRLLRLVLLAALGIGAVGTALAASVGPWAVVTFFGARVWLPAHVLGFLGLSTMLLMTAQILQAILVAYRAHHAATISWVASTAVLVGLLALPLPAIQAAVIAQVCASTVVVAVMITALLPRVRNAAVASPVPP